jgi:mRNA interferase RelE/StbE
MAKQLIFAERFKRNYQELPNQIQQRFEKKLVLFLENPKHPSLNIHRYQSREDVWEAYITDKYRFTFIVRQESIIFRNIGHHSIIDKGEV